MKYIDFPIDDKSWGWSRLNKYLELRLSAEENDQSEPVFLMLKMKYDFPTTAYKRLNKNL